MKQTYFCIINYKNFSQLPIIETFTQYLWFFYFGRRCSYRTFLGKMAFVLLKFFRPSRIDCNVTQKSGITLYSTSTIFLFSYFNIFQIYLTVVLWKYFVCIVFFIHIIDLYHKLIFHNHFISKSSNTSLDCHWHNIWNIKLLSIW